MLEHIKRHRNAYSLLFLALVAVMVAWLFLRVEALDIQVSKITGSIFSARPSQSVRVNTGAVVAPDNVGINQRDVTVSGQLNDLPAQDASAGATIPGGGVPNDSNDASADVSGVQGNAGDLPGSHDDEDEPESN
ncbi:hypothetical protein JW752_01005 [Candidatus Peregrinibacteria bacterium]|nr:hypothetical protein [Candidatus Peregrinibacteria bacterium]